LLTVPSYDTEEISVNEHTQASYSHLRRSTFERL